MDEQGIKMFDLKPSANEKLHGFLDPKGTRVARSRIASIARNRAKLKNCFYCHSEVEGMCNSHLIPKFIIKNIAKDGKLIGYQQILETPAGDEDVGINAACTFQVICRNCDSTVFQKYESPESYEIEPDNDILAQIALKNHLVEISKKLEDVQIYDPDNPSIPLPVDFCHTAYNVAKADLESHVNEFEFAKSISEGLPSAIKFKVGFFTKLDYVVPIAAQCCFALIAGLEGEIVNNPYDHHPNYKVQYLHLAIFPLESSSVVLLFIKESDTRYRRFFRKLSNLPQTDQLSIIFYILLLYSENFLLSKELPETILKDENIMNAFSKSTETVILDQKCDSLTLAMREFSLVNHTSVPNLLYCDFATVNNREDEANSTKVAE